MRGTATMNVGRSSAMSLMSIGRAGRLYAREAPTLRSRYSIILSKQCQEGRSEM